MASRADTVLRGITEDGAFRVIAADTTDTVRGAIESQSVEGDAARMFADLVTGAILVRESMAPELRVQTILQGDDGKSRMIADTYPDGMTRGLIQVAKDAKVMTIRGRGMLQVARSLANGSIHQGIVNVPESGSISSALMAYMQESEQVVTMISVGTLLGEDGKVASAAGYLVQLLPEVVEGPLMVMAERLKDFENLEPLLKKGTASPKELLDEILYGMPYTEVGARPVHFGCTCSPARLAASLSMLSKADIEEILSEKKVLDVECDYCKRRFEFHPEQLRGLLESN